jgi:hypothetical protein
LTAEEHTALQKGLGQLAETMPPRAVWHRIREQAEAEGLLQQTVMRKRSTWYAGFGVAAAALLAAVMLPGTFQTPTGQGTNVSPVVMTDTPVELNALQTVMRAGTIATISDLEDRIAAIDYQLNDPTLRMTPEDRELFWRERVRLMNSLLALRYAQAQRAAF